MAQIACSAPPVRVFECETVLEQFGRNNSPTLEDEFCLCPHEDCANLEHPLVRRQAARETTSLAEQPHELGIRQGIRRRHVHDSLHVFAIAPLAVPWGITATESASTMYGLIGKMTAVAGQRDALACILPSSGDRLLSLAAS
jgi:hypothetical protein